MPWQLQQAEAVPQWVLEELSQLQEALQSRDTDFNDLMNNMPNTY